MKFFWIEDDCGLTKVISRKGKRTKTLRFCDQQDLSKARATILDHGNGWEIKDGYGTIGLNYSRVVDLVAAFIIWQRQGDNLWEGCIYGEKIAEVKSRIVNKKRSKK